MTGKPTKKLSRRARQSKIDVYQHLLGCVKDKVIMDKANVSMPAVSRYRTKKGVDSFTRNIKRIAASMNMVNSTSVEAAAAELNVPAILIVAAKNADKLGDSKTLKSLKIDKLIAKSILDMNVVFTAEPATSADTLGAQFQISSKRSYAQPLKAFEITVSAGEDEQAFYTVASSFQEAAQKAEAAQRDGRFRGELVRLRAIGPALS